MSETLTIADVERIAALARLALTDDEKALYARQLTRILDYARQVGELEALDRPEAAPAPEIQVEDTLERVDESRPSLDRPAALANGPDTADGLFRVPRVLGDD